MAGNDESSRADDETDDDDTDETLDWGAVVDFLCTMGSTTGPQTGSNPLAGTGNAPTPGNSPGLWPGFPNVNIGGRITLSPGLNPTLPTGLPGVPGTGGPTFNPGGLVLGVHITIPFGGGR